MATHDVLTDLPNRRFLQDKLEQMMRARDRREMACLYLDLDRFKEVNDRCGHEIGDQLLKRVAAEILRCIRASDVLARLGGDEFTVVLTGISNQDRAKEVAQRIIERIESIETIDGHVVDASVSIGILFIPTGPLQRPLGSEDLLRAVDRAMYIAKRSGRGRYHVLDSMLDDPTAGEPPALHAVQRTA